MGTVRNSKKNDTENAGPGPKTNVQYCGKYRQRKRAWTTKSASSLRAWVKCG